MIGELTAEHLLMIWLLIISYTVLLQHKAQQSLRNIFEKRPLAALYISLPFIFTNIWHGAKYGLSPLATAAFAIYLTAPLLILQFADKKNQRIQIWDIVSISILWLVFDWRYLQQSWTAFSYIMIGVPATIAAVTAFSCLRRLDGLKFNTKVTLADLGIMVKGFCFLTIVILPVGFMLDFLEWNPKPEKIIILPLIFFTTAMIEELLFRGLIQNLLNNTFAKHFVVLAFTSLLFGLAHLENNAGGFGWPNWRYAFLATIAGFGYGTVYNRTQSIVVPAFLHTLVDSIWVSFLAKG